MKVFPKLFLIWVVFLSVFMGASGWLLYGTLRGVATGAAMGAVSGLAVGLLHYWLVRRMSSGKSEGAMGLHHVRTVELRLPYDKAFDLCVESVGTIRRCTVRKEEREAGKISARAGINWKTWADTISFEVRNLGNGGIQVEVSSRPTIRMTVVDFGKNLDNVEKISGFLNAHSTSAE